VIESIVSLLLIRGAPSPNAGSVTD
jgi:hypothetical protein